MGKKYHLGAKMIERKLATQEQYWIEKAQMAGRFQDSGKVVKGRLCNKCSRREYSHPDTCEDATYESLKMAERCLNFKEK